MVEELHPYQVHELYLSFSANENTYIDISETIALKIKGLQCHVSQLGPDAKWLDRIYERSAAKAQEAKEKKGLTMQYAEAFRRIKLYVPD